MEIESEVLNMYDEKICNFYANEVHLGVTIVPFVANKIKEVTPELCRVADERYRRLDRVLEQKPINDGVWNGLHLQKTNKNLRWYSVHRVNQYHDR